MCGFFGVVDFLGRVSPLDQQEILAGTSVLSHRGPDDSGFTARRNICIGFRRLSIIDLAAPSQPYFNEDNSILMVCNGEIYNYLDLKKHLESKRHIFRTKTDSEVILHGYEEWGDSLWGKLNGIFAIALWNENNRKLYLVRDHLGVKPLHYMIADNRVYFGSDYNAFLKQSFLKIEFNRQALLSYLSFRYVVGEQTFYKNIKDILAGCCLTFSQRNIKKNFYWDIPLTEEQDRGWKYYLSGLDEKIDLAVKRQLMGDVPLGAFISGGLDSSLLLYYMAKRKNGIKIFVTGFNEEGYNEFSYAELIARSLNIVPRQLTLELNEYTNNMDEVISYRGEPASIPHEAAFLKMSKFLKKEITVVISGEGADELFAGYGRIFRSPFDYYKQKMTNSVPWMKTILSNIFRESLPKNFKSPMEHFLWRYSWFTENDKNNLLNMDYFDNQQFDDYSLSYITSLFDRLANRSYYSGIYYILGKIHLVNLLNRLDRMTMAASVEARVPFLDYDLVEFVSKMPIHYKLRWNSFLQLCKALFNNSEKISEKYDTPKFILKHLAKGKVPESIIKRNKMGFPVPLDRWFSNKFKLKAIELLLSRDSKTRDFTNTKNLKYFLQREKYDSSYDYDGKKIWMLMNLEIWLRKTFQ